MLLRRFHQKMTCRKGQAMTEYIALVILIALVCIPFFTLLPEAVRGYVRPFYYCISKPFP